MQEIVTPKCPKCRSKKTCKNGFSIRKTGKIQRFLCKLCGHVFLEE